MARELLPIFPLNAVLFPRTHLPLHIFEERYKLMIGEALRDGSEFGIVLSHENGLVNTGCSALVSKMMKQYDDGRMDIITVGRRRFEIYLLNEELEYLRGAVEFFDDDDDPPPLEKVYLEQAVRGFYACRNLDVAAPQPERDLPEPDLNDPQLSFQLAQGVPDLGLRQSLLAMRSEADRLKHLAQFFPNYLAKEKRIEHLRKTIPTNGHGKLKDY
jgi:Lon protease-like protein